MMKRDGKHRGEAACNMRYTIRPPVEVTATLYICLRSPSVSHFHIAGGYSYVYLPEPYTS